MDRVDKIVADTWSPELGLPYGARPAGHFVETREYRRFAEFCASCRHFRWIGVCTGDAGVGKTASSRRFARWDTLEPFVATYLSHANEEPGQLADCRTVLYTASQTDGPRTVATRIAQLRLALSYLVADAARAAEGTGRALVEPPDCTELIIVDEADQLKVPALEELRNIYDRGGVGLVLEGLPEFRHRLTRYPKLYSRTGFRHDFRALQDAEATTIVLEHADALHTHLTREDFPDADAVLRIVEITRGNFRLLDRLLGQVELILGVTRGKPDNAGKRVVVTCALVELAIDRLVLGD